MTGPTMNYGHLRYFLVVAREGSMTAAAEAMGVTQPTVSAQVAELERDLGVRLFLRRGNRLELTEAGQTTLGYAAEIFSLGSELMDAVTGSRQGRPRRLVVGVSDALPLLTEHQILQPVLALPVDAIHLVFRVDKPDRLLAGLAARTYDVLLLEMPVGPTAPIRAHSTLLSRSDVGIFGRGDLVAELSGDLPGALDGAPFLLHTESTPMRRRLDAWFTRQGIRPRVAAEVEEVAFLQVLGQSGRGFFAAPMAVERRIRQQYGVELVCLAEGVREEIYAATLKGASDHPAVRLLLDHRPSEADDR